MARRSLGNDRVGESEFSHGYGLMPNVKSGYVPEQVDVLRAERRTDSTDAASTASYDDLGNPDRFGPQPALQQPYVKPAPSGINVKNPGGGAKAYEPRVKRRG